MNFLILESTCDETAAAIVDQDLQVLSSALATQDQLHSRYHGVVPEIAARAHVENFIPVIDLALERAQLTWTDIGAVAVAHTPGLVGSLAIGLTVAKTLAVVLDIPLIGVNHLHAHIYACRLSAGRDVFPCVGLVVSGGHSSIYKCTDSCQFELLGGTLDDAAGEAFDKVAALLGLGFPGGPAVGKAAQFGDPRAYRFPRAFIHEPDRLQFSFSGLKTAVRYAIAPPGATNQAEAAPLSESQIADLAASFQEAVVDCLVAKSLAASRITGLPRICMGGGVAANRRLRERMSEACAAAEVELFIAPPQLCTDNAVMGAIAVERFQRGLCERLDLDLIPGLVR